MSGEDVIRLLAALGVLFMGLVAVMIGHDRATGRWRRFLSAEATEPEPAEVRALACVRRVNRSNVAYRFIWLMKDGTTRRLEFVEAPLSPNRHITDARSLWERWLCLGWDGFTLDAATIVLTPPNPDPVAPPVDLGFIHNSA